MNFNSINYFITLAEERNFTRAAKRLYITQQSLSSHILSMEEELGCTLLDRKNPLELTYAGETFLKYSRTLQNTITSMEQEMNDIVNNERGTLRIGVNYSRSIALMPEILNTFHERHPKIKVELYDNDDLTQLLLIGRLDIAIVHKKENLKNIIFDPFYTDQTVLLLSKELRNTLGIKKESILESLNNGNLNALNECPFICAQKKGKLEDIFKNLIDHSEFIPIIQAQGNNSGTIIRLCSNNFGACFVPKSVITKIATQEILDRIEMYTVPSDYDYMVYFAYNKQSYLWSMVQEFMNISRQYKKLNDDGL